MRGRVWLFIGFVSLFALLFTTPALGESSTGVLTGRVLSSVDNSPIAGTAVRIDNTVIPSDADGEFRFTLVHPGTYTIYYDAPGHESQAQGGIVICAGQTIVLPTAVLRANTGIIKGKVISSATNLPIAGTAVRIDNTVIPSDADGEFRFTLVHPGTYTMHYDAPGHLPQTQELIRVEKGKCVTLPMVVMSADGPPRILLKVSENRLYLFYGSYLVKSYPVATGMPGWPTPRGTFTIIRKDVNPTWYPPGWADVEKPVPPGPSNPLGTRRLLLSDPSYGIHGTNKISSIGKYITHGCIRLYPWDIVDLFDRVTVGTIVDIVT